MKNITFILLLLWGASATAQTSSWTSSPSAASVSIQDSMKAFIEKLLTDNNQSKIYVVYDPERNKIDFFVNDMNDDMPERGDFGNAINLDQNGAIRVSGQKVGDLLYYDGNAWVSLPLDSLAQMISEPIQ